MLLSDSVIGEEELDGVKVCVNDEPTRIWDTLRGATGTSPAEATLDAPTSAKEPRAATRATRLTLEKRPLMTTSSCQLDVVNVGRGNEHHLMISGPLFNFSERSAAQTPER
jgi:hypothetical protein